MPYLEETRERPGLCIPCARRAPADPGNRRATRAAAARRIGERDDPFEGEEL